MTNTIIVGAGIIGCATAYYLTETEGIDASTIHIVEAAPELFASASGKAAGFLAADWFAPAVLPLGQLSFKLHKELADEHGGFGKWGYSPSTGISYVEPPFVPSTNGEGPHDWLLQGTSRSLAAGKHEFKQGDGPAWLARRHGDSIDVIGEHSSVAQVDPFRLSDFLLQESKRRGVHVHQPARVTNIELDEGREPSFVTIRHDDGKTVDLPCSTLLLAAGAWTRRVFDHLFPQSSLELPVSQFAGHSIVIRSPRYSVEQEKNGCHAIFSTMSNGLSPEIMSRIGGEIWVAGLNSSTIPLPDLPTDAVIDGASIAELLEVSRKLLGSGMDVDDLVLEREGLCFRPITPSGKPILSKVPQKHLPVGSSPSTQRQGGVFVAAGHGPWGIALSLGTGKVMSELLLGQSLSADISKLAIS